MYLFREGRKYKKIKDIGFHMSSLLLEQTRILSVIHRINQLSMSDYLNNYTEIETFF